MKWEYLTVPIFMGLYSMAYPFNAARSHPIDELGADRWELVTVIEYKGDQAHLGYFKREFREQRSKD